jgi:hypothetical protein
VGARYGAVVADLGQLKAPDLYNLLDFFPPLLYNIVMFARLFAPGKC